MSERIDVERLKSEWQKVRPSVGGDRIDLQLEILLNILETLVEIKQELKGRP